MDCSIEYLEKSLLDVPENYEILLIGDFNVDFLSSDKAEKPDKRKLRNFAIGNDLDQLITTPTRVTESTKSTRYLLFVNNSHRIVACGTITSSISDHFVIFCIVKSGVPKASPKLLNYRSYKNYDKNSFLRDLSAVDWDSIVDTSENIDDVVSNWSVKFNMIAEQHAHLKQCGLKESKYRG